jgi:shikimate dehydrogenase
VRPGQVEPALRGLAALGFCGANVTVPHKQAVMGLLDSIAADAQTLGAVNTLVVERGADGATTVSGYNTDARGFVAALQEGGFEPKDRRALVVGAGGAARAVVFGLCQAGASRITVLNRTLGRAKPLADLGAQPLPLTVETLVESARAADLLVNATSVGMWPHVESSVWPEDVPVPSHLTVFDLVYNPLETRLLRQARETGARAVDGLGMLIRQGALAFEMWIGQDLDLEEIATLMRSACERALRE